MYPTSALNSLKTNITYRYSVKQAQSNHNRHQIDSNNHNKCSTICKVLPFTKWLSKSFKMYVVRWEPDNTLRNLLVAPKDKDNITKKSGELHRFNCVPAKCEEEYIGGSAWTFRERFKEHLRAPSHLRPW